MMRRCLVAPLRQLSSSSSSSSHVRSCLSSSPLTPALRFSTSGASASVGASSFAGKITTGEEYLQSLRGRKLKVYYFGELVDNIVDHPVIRPSINAVAQTYDLAAKNPELASAISPYTGERVNRFLHIARSPEDLMMQNKMQRRLGQLTGTCFQRCVGMDACNTLHSVTFDMDEARKKQGLQPQYHQRFLDFLKEAQLHGWVLGGAMTDVKGDRSKAPHAQTDADMYLRVTRRTDQGIYIKGAKAHQTGALNSHALIILPTTRLLKEDKDYAVACVLPVDAPGITYIYGRQSCDTRASEPIDSGNFRFSGQEAMIVFDDVFVPWNRVLMDGEVEFAASLVERFTGYHRRSYVCKSGVGDVVIGAAASAAEFNGVDNVSHIKDKLVEMTHLNETIYATGMMASAQGTQQKSGVFQPDDMLANVCKHHVTRFPYEIGRLGQDLAGGLMVTMPSERDFKSPVVGPILEKYLKGRPDVPTEHRVRILRLMENMTLGRNAVGYLTESMHGAGSPQAQRIQIARQFQLDVKKTLAKHLAGIPISEATRDSISTDLSQYFARVFKPVSSSSSQQPTPSSSSSSSTSSKSSSS